MDEGILLLIMMGDAFMRNIIVVECISTGKNFIEDIVNRGYNPVVLDLKNSDTEDGRKFAEHIREEY